MFKPCDYTNSDDSSPWGMQVGVRGGWGAGQMAQLLTALAALSEDLSSISSDHMEDHNHV